MAAKHSPNKHEQDIGADVIRDQRSTVKTLKAENQLLKRQLQEARRANENRHRRFFTRQYHCRGHRSHHSLRNWFGLTKDFDDLTKLVQIFLPTYNVEEAHSRDEQGAKLTPFEQCLLAKAYEYDVMTVAPCGTEVTLCCFMLGFCILAVLFTCWQQQQIARTTVQDLLFCCGSQGGTKQPKLSRA